MPEDNIGAGKWHKTPDVPASVTVCFNNYINTPACTPMYISINAH